MARSIAEMFPRATRLQRRVLLAEALGPPRVRAPWRPPAAIAETPPPPARAVSEER